MNECTIKWNSLTVEEWEQRFARVCRSNILQSYDYARAICPLHHQKARWGLVLIGGQEAGLVQILEAGGGPFHAIVLDRGPLWFDGFGSKDQQSAFFTAFNREFPRRIGRRRRIIPESTVFEGIKGYKKLDNPGYQTIWVNLRPDEAELRAGLQQKWRNSLNKAEKHTITVEWDQKLEYFSWLLIKYQEDRAKKDYDGPSVKVLAALARAFSERGNVLIGRAVLAGHIVGALLILCHGSSATYQVGWTSEEGRKTGAQNILLWQAMLYLKKKGITDFDLGGLNDGTAKNVGKFKAGLGGELVRLCGQYC